MMPAWKLGTVQLLALGCVGIVMGAWLKKKFPLFDRLCIPTSIVGGMVFALLALAFHARHINVEVETTLRDVMMVAFMTTVGLNARWGLVRRGGTKVVLMLGLASVGALLQNLLGIGLAKVLHVNPLVGILSGSVALTGGPATAAAFGPTFEKMGVTGATELATAAATFGIAISGLVGGYIGGSLIRRHRLRAETQGKPGEAVPASLSGTEKTGLSQDKHGQDTHRQDAHEVEGLLPAVLLIGVAMGAGSLISDAMTRLHIILPSYIGAMIAAAVIRNLNDKFHFFGISQARVDECATAALYLFIVTAVLTLQLWKLAELALPLIVMLAAQVVLCWLMCMTASFYLMGRNYESAVMASGFCGFMLGITANAMAAMEELVEKFGPAPQAFLVVPVVGAFLVDFTNALIITGMANALR